MLELIEQMKQLQDTKEVAKQEQQRADKWNKYYKILEMEYSRALHMSAGHLERADNIES